MQHAIATEAAADGRLALPQRWLAPSAALALDVTQQQLLAKPGATPWQDRNRNWFCFAS
jgi:hypothetical protein